MARKAPANETAKCQMPSVSVSLKFYRISVFICIRVVCHCCVCFGVYKIFYTVCVPVFSTFGGSGWLPLRKHAYTNI